MNGKYVNLACGPIFIDSQEWVNFDFFAPQGVHKADLLKKLPLPDNSAQVVYLSHFLEHIPKMNVDRFIRECFRILAPNGTIRLVLPDLENMAQTYLKLRNEENHSQANFLVMEIIDQCVRKKPGGELGEYYQKIKANVKLEKNVSSENSFMVNFIKNRTGEDLNVLEHQKVSINKIEPQYFSGLLGRIRSKLLSAWIKLLSFALPSSFRIQNMSFAKIGELHHWLWDFYQLKEVLEKEGFISIKRQSANTSYILDFPFYPLDIDREGKPRKGEESMFIEAKKPF